jgi:hypothetical protein
MRFMHSGSSALAVTEAALGWSSKIFLAALFGCLSGASLAAPSVGVRSGVNCPGAYLETASGKTCQATPDYKDLIYLGENSRKVCKYPYTRINAGDSKWCVLYPDP